MGNIPTRYTHAFNVSSFTEIANSRSAPSILLLNHELKIIYYSSEALEFIKNNPFLFDDSSTADGLIELPLQIREYANKFKETLNNQESLPNFPPLVIQDPGRKDYYCFRLIPTISSENYEISKHEPSLILLIEKIIPLEKLAKSYKISKREKEILKLLFTGCSNKEIADQLYICEYTVGDHIKNIMRKLDVKNRLSIVLKFLEH